MPGRVRVMMGVGRRVGVRMVLHLAGPGGRRGALVVLRRHLASGTRAAGGVGAAPAAHAAEVTRRRAARYGTSAAWNTNTAREPGTGFQNCCRAVPCARARAHARIQPRRAALLRMQLRAPEWDRRRKLY